jgi:LysR family transcriptional regulator for bpeEF and oprC
VLAGLGIGHSATWLYAPELASGEVIRLLKEHAPPLVPIHAVTAGRRMSNRVSVFVEFLAEVLAGDPHLKIR